MPRRGWPCVLLVALLVARGASPLGADDDKARATLAAGLTKIAKQLAGVTKESVVAMLDVRCDAEADPLQESCEHVQVAVQQVLLANSVYVFRAEADRPLTVEYAGGALPKGNLFKNEDLAHWRDKQHAEFLIDPRVTTSGGKSVLVLAILNLKKGGAAQRPQQELPKPDDCDYEKVCDLGLLPECNREILLFAFSRVGQTVRTGECTELPADPMLRLGRMDFGTQGDYKFGKKVQWKDALPGDVLTTSNHVMVLIKPLKKPLGSPIIHQNTQNKRYVILDNIRDYMVGEMKIWRPSPKDE